MTEYENSRSRFSYPIRGLILIVLLGASWLSLESATANQAVLPKTIILVRHAEKKIVPPENKDPDLSAAGEKRAQEIARMFSGSGIAAIYATQYKRTQQTVKPLADRLRLPISRVEARKSSDLVEQIRARPAGQTIFVAGHNNTVPEIIGALGGPSLPIIPETEYDNLYILTIQSDGAVKLVTLKYGSSKPASGQSMTKP
ncbi:MAG TPA: phosphoglycerate mutase family protein [Pyrinomonadaceae bacterium]|nr:phosphoglycerate mutase family protein [Pyrinomonadaceae bacterium]